MIKYNSNFGYARWFKMDVFILRCWHILLQIKNVVDGFKLGLWPRWNFNSLLSHNIFMIYDYTMIKLGYFEPTYFNKVACFIKYLGIEKKLKITMLIK
jgi:hypothetical protein